MEVLDQRKKILFNLISHKQDTDLIHLYTKDPFEAKYQLLINKRESTGLKHLNTQMIWMIFIKILKSTVQIKTPNTDQLG